MKKLFKEFTAAQLARLKREYEPLKGKRIPMNQIEKMQTMLSKYSTDMLVKLANTDIPFIATAAKNIAVVKRGKKWSDFKTKLDMAEADELQCEACWDSHKQVGTKISSKTGKRVPNCVPKEELQEVLDMQEGGMKDVALDLDSLSDKEFKTKHGKSKEEMKKSLEGVQEALDKDDEKSVDDVVKQLKKAVKAHQGQVKSLTKDLKDEADLSKTQVKMVHKKADDMPKKGFMKRYGKDGDAVRYATATNMVKKKLGIEDVEEAFTKKDFKNNERENDHSGNATKVVGMFGTAKEKEKIADINKRHMKANSISRADQTERDAIVNKYYGKLKEGRVLTNPGVAAALRQYIAQRPFISNKKDYEELMKLSLKDMNAFNVKYKSMNANSQSGVKAALAKKGLSSTLVNDNKPKGDQTMNESYKDKFNATMKKFGINSLDDLKSDEDKKKFFKAVDDSHDAKNEELEEAMNISTAKKEIQKIYDKAKKDDNLGGKGHDDFKDLLKQTDTKKLYPKMHKLGTFLASVRRAFGQKLDPSSAKAQALGNELIKLSYKVNEELEEELTPAQKKLPVGLQKAIAAKGDKKDEMMTAEMMKKEMMKKMEMLKAETDPSKVEMMKKEMMTAMKEMGDMPEMMKKEMMKKMDEYGSMNAMKEAVSPAQQAAIAISKKEKEEKHTPSHKETAVNAMAMNAMKKETAKKEMMKMNAMKMPIQSMYGKMNAMKTGDDDLTPMNNMKLNAMIKDPHKSKGDDPKKDMNATYMKSDVRGDVKNGGGTDMSKVNDNPKPMAAMKKINAMYKTEKYLDEKPGSIQNVVAEMYQTGKLKG